MTRSAHYTNQYQEILLAFAYRIADKLDLRSRHQLFLLCSNVETKADADKALNLIQSVVTLVS